MANPRKAISKKLRFEIFKRDGFTCQYCGAVPPKVILEVDHVIPVIDGGDNDIDNLITSCFCCNRGKGATSLNSVPETLKQKADRIREQEAQLQGYSEVMAAKRERLENDKWEVAEIFCEVHGIDPVKTGLNRQWLESIKRFVEQLGVHEVIDAMEIAVAKKPRSQQQCFKYFCGVCWNKVRGSE